ncbi:DNA-methyltransferase [Campylobacter jejuni]|uniref:DNA-methyltransferase n=1 Tax=Campylobacter jejuni TaxID=197 RepID=UPI000F8131EE|nr:site-specific DNA-methyltransferase [Campylobacter jejuni]RTI73399.1 site-specific DNA-methyltransferase [Campylobacter jejuni]
MLNYNKIYSFEVFDFLKQIDDSCVDLAIIDPPYNLKVADWDNFKTEKDFLDFSYAWIEAFLPKMKANGSFYIFNTPFNCALFLNYLKNKKVFFQNFITWYKKDGMSSCKKRFNNNQESILFYTMNKNKFSFNADEVRIPYLSTNRIKHAQNKGILKNGKRWFPNPKGRLCPDVWEITSQRHKEKVDGKIIKPKHPTIKPYEMIERIIKASSNENDVVLDLFAGSGIALKVCQDLNRLYLGTDFNFK